MIRWVESRVGRWVTHHDAFFMSVLYGVAVFMALLWLGEGGGVVTAVIAAIGAPAAVYVFMLWIGLHDYKTIMGERLRAQNEGIEANGE